MATLADLETAYLTGLGKTGTLPDQRHAQYAPDEFTYFSGLSGLVPAQQFSLGDHKLTYYRATASAPSATLADAKRIAWGG